jgi:hypothetical protein
VCVCVCVCVKNQFLGKHVILTFVYIKHRYIHTTCVVLKFYGVERLGGNSLKSSFRLRNTVQVVLATEVGSGEHAKGMVYMLDKGVRQTS